MTYVVIKINTYHNNQKTKHNKTKFNEQQMWFQKFIQISFKLKCWFQMLSTNDIISNSIDQNVVKQNDENKRKRRKRKTTIIASNFAFHMLYEFDSFIHKWWCDKTMRKKFKIFSTYVDLHAQFCFYIQKFLQKQRKKIEKLRLHIIKRIWKC